VLQGSNNERKAGVADHGAVQCAVIDQQVAVESSYQSQSAGGAGVADCTARQQALKAL